MKCAIYVRVSTETQASKGYSLAAQEKAGIELCKKNGWAHDVFLEAGRSADKETLDNRPELQRLLELADEGCFDCCFATELDRLSRNPVTLAYIKKVFRDNGVKIVTLGQTFDLTEDEDDFMSDLLGILAKRENRVRVRRSERGKLEAALKGKWVGGIHPFGYAKDTQNKLIPHPEENQVYSQIVRWCLEGLGAVLIARRLNAMGVKTKGTSEYHKGKIFCWQSGTVHRLLTNPLYKGSFGYKGHMISIPSLVSQDTWNQVQEAVARRRNGSPAETKHFYLLQGLLECGRCGRRLFGRIKSVSRCGNWGCEQRLNALMNNGKYKGKCPKCGSLEVHQGEDRVYVCLSKRADPEPRSCGLKSPNLDKVERVVWEQVRRIVFNTDLVRKAIEHGQAEGFVDSVEIEAEEGRLRHEIEARDAEIVDLVRRRGRYQHLSDDDIDRAILQVKQEKDALIQQREKLTKQIQKLDTARGNLSRLEATFRTLAKKIDKFTPQERYEFIHLIISRIIVDYDEKAKTHHLKMELAIPLEIPQGELAEVLHLQHHSCRRWFSRRWDESEARRGLAGTSWSFVPR